VEKLVDGSLIASRERLTSRVIDVLISLAIPVLSSKVEMVLTSDQKAQLGQVLQSVDRLSTVSESFGSTALSWSYSTEGLFIHELLDFFGSLWVGRHWWTTLMLASLQVVCSES